MNAPQPAIAGSGWDRLAQAVAEVLPPAEVDAVWLFTLVRRDAKEWGTAVVSRVDGERRRIYTARYVLTVKGKERGKFEASVQEVGTGPIEAFDRLVQEAHRRLDDEHPPVSIPPESWFPSVPADTRADGATR